MLIPLPLLHEQGDLVEFSLVADRGGSRSGAGAGGGGGGGGGGAKALVRRVVLVERGGGLPQERGVIVKVDGKEGIAELREKMRRDRAALRAGGGAAAAAAGRGKEPQLVAKEPTPPRGVVAPQPPNPNPAS